MSRNFALWLSSMRESINEYGYYVDFEKVYQNVDNIKVELCILNSLIGDKNIKESFISLLNKYPTISQCIPLLLAVRQMEIYAQDAEGAMIYNFKPKSTNTPEQFATFMEKTGLFKLISERIVNNLIDYVTGIETGLDSNARKNRGGHQMENLVESYIIKTGAPYFKEMYLADVEKRWNVCLDALSGEGTSTKRWDFVIYANNCIHLIETNFYTSGGSKLNETARSYKLIAQEAKQIPGVKFIWITDGKGWLSARRNLEETFNELDTLYNISDLENGALTELISSDCALDSSRYAGAEAAENSSNHYDC